jgi:hypothetical protein
MQTNHVICRNRVEVEGFNVGKFESLHTQASSRTLGASAVLTLPLYALGVGGTSGRASKRLRRTDNIIKVCSEVKVYVWYDYWNAESLAFDSMPEVLAFSGWIEHIAEGYPAKIYLQDNTFILRFGAIEKAWNEDATVQEIMEDCIPIAQAGFDDERKRLGFTREVPRLKYSLEDKQVQAQTSSLSFRNWGGRSPFDTLQKLMQLLVLYGGVSSTFNVFVGVGVKENDRPIIKLDTRTNVIERDIIPIDGRFVDYDVKVFGILKNGRQYAATGGYRTSKSAAERGQFEREYGGEAVRGHTVANTVEGIQKHADDLLEMLRENRNKGTIKLLLYPKLELMDWVQYTDSVFEGLSGSYYVLEYSFSADLNGYFQTIQATDKVFNL